MMLPTIFSTWRNCFLFLILPAWVILLFSSNDPARAVEKTNSGIAGHNDDDVSQNILLVTAHPDDECMFFAPTILKLVGMHGNDVDAKIRLHALCLSNGNMDGLGARRETEFQGSLDVLGIPVNNRRILGNTFKDNISAFWDFDLVAYHVKEYVNEYNIDTILTFDERGISLHPNHISLFAGVSKLLLDPSLRSCQPYHDLLSPSAECLRPRILRIFALRTVGILPKYSGLLGVALKRTQLLACAILAGFLPSQWCRSGTTYISSWKEYVTALLAMMQHRSQLVWFRWLYVTWSRYMWINDWVEIVA